MDTASVELTRLGFTLTPFSTQSHRLHEGAPLLPAGTANRCVMLQNGYLEFLTPTHDTPNARQLRDTIARYTGVHLIAFGTQTPAADFERLEREGFTPLPPVALQRQVGTAEGEATARFTVVRVPPATMPEGRIQYCQHHTPEVVWQPRWTSHANGAVGLAGVLLCVEDPQETAQRYARFTGLVPIENGGFWRLNTARGYVLFGSPAAMRHWLDVAPPALPWIAGYVIDSGDLTITKHCTGGTMRGQHLFVSLPATLGGVMLFQAQNAIPRT